MLLLREVNATEYYYQNEGAKNNKMNLKSSTNVSYLHDISGN